MKPKGGLGRGLSALIPATAPLARDVDVDLITPNPRQPRWEAANSEALTELAESIRTHGVIQPLIVAELPQPGAVSRYQLIAGERRWRAARLAGLTRVPAIVKEATAQDALELALVENVQRADLNPLEEAAAYRQLSDEFGLSQEAIAGRVGKSRVAVANALRLLRLPDEVKRALAEGTITEGHARALLGLEDPAGQLAALAIVQGRDLNVRQTEELVRRLRQPAEREPVAQPPSSPQPAVDDLEAQFEAALGTKVKLVRSGRGGRLMIYFYSEEELQGLYEAIVER